MTAIRLSAPMAGWASSLDAVPDSVFAERMMGDGIAIDPLDGLLRAPCDAEVIAVARTGHGITLRLANGAELLIHIGLETVKLDGEGFTALVADGAAVREGDPLIRFDLDLVARRAESLITPIVVASEGYRVLPIALDRPVAAGDPLMEVERSGPAAEDAGPAGGDSIAREAIVAAANGVHARPAARIAAALRPFTARVRLAGRGGEANARSPVSLMALGLRHGDAVTITGEGADGPAAVDAVAAVLGQVEADSDAMAATPQATAGAASAGPRFRGVPASPGLVVGPIVQLRPIDLPVPEQGKSVASEAAALDAAIDAARATLGGDGNGPAGEIEAAHRALLDDPELHRSAQQAIAEGKSAGFAWRAAARASAEAISATGNRLLIERIDDLLDVERQVIARLAGGGAQAMPILPPSAILVAETLLPSQFLALDRARLGGIVTAGGGPTSHVAILAASAGIPMLVAAGRGVLDLDEGRTAILDADMGIFDGNPEADQVEDASSRADAAQARRRTETDAARAACVMADGTRIEIFANLASTADAVRAVAMGAEGCGLLRTEFLFLDRDDVPSEAEQEAAYAEIAAALEGRPLIIRTLDIGADKPVPYLRLPAEENPALGRRGVRLSLDRPDLLAAQLHAIVRGVPPAQCRIMVPMVVDRDELRFVRAALNEAAAKAGAPVPPLGVMIETPAAALLAGSLAAEADFLSIGTNDLGQYALAADRLNPALAGMVDALHPAVLRLIAQAAEGAARHGRILGICGGIASDPKSAAILIGLGATELSAAPAAIPTLKARVRRLSLDACRTLAERALGAETAPEVRALLEGEEG